MKSTAQVFVQHGSTEQLLYLSALTELIDNGNNIVIKPNFLTGVHKLNNYDSSSVITAAHVITLVLEAITDKIHNSKIYIVDAPQTDSSWELIVKNLPLHSWHQIGQRTRNSIELIDLREEEWIVRNDVVVKKQKLKGDPLGSILFNLGEDSEFFGHVPSKKGYYGADYNKNETNWAHSCGRHIYKVSKTILTADVVINLPKLKTHKKAGITCSLKNLVGISTHKNYLPHHNEGTVEEGGDQFPVSGIKSNTEAFFLPRFKRLLYFHPLAGTILSPIKILGKKIFGDTHQIIRSGNWYGNDTVWRMALDLNKILLYGNSDGTLRQPIPENMKKYICIVDGILAGEGNGPESPTPVRANLLLYGLNPVSVDAVSAKIMGFDWLKIPTVQNAFQILNYPICDFSYDEIEVISNNSKWNKLLKNIDNSDVFHFTPHFGWKGHIEL